MSKSKLTDADDLLPLADVNLSPSGDADVVADVLVAANTATAEDRPRLRAQAMMAAGGSLALQRLVDRKFKALS